MSRSRKKRERTNKLLLIILLFVVILTVFTRWVIGYIETGGLVVLIIALCGLSYYAGTRRIHRRIKFLRRPVIINGRKQPRNRPDIYGLDINSAYPPELTDPKRVKLLNDPLSGARPLHPEK